MPNDISPQFDPPLLPMLPDSADTVPVDEGLDHIEFQIRHDLQKRLDIYLRDRLPHHSRSMLQKLIRTEAVLVNNRPAKSSTLLRAGDTIRLDIPPAADHKAEPENIPLDVLYEDADFLALNKQADILVHPARGHWTGTLINGLLYHARVSASTLSTGSAPWRPGIIHRLDRHTTGLILIAKTDEAHWRIAGQFERRTIRKTYLAVVHGTPALDSDLIDAPLGIHIGNREKYAVRSDNGRPAQTVYSVKERFGRFSLLELSPKTGRTHQIRVHLAHIGHPIVGDVTYGGREISYRDIIGSTVPTTTDIELPIIRRQALHALRLQFVHPTNFKRITLEAPLPLDLAELLRLLRQTDR